MAQGVLAITFDDGFKSDLTFGLQEQLDRGMEPKGTSYIITSASSSGRINYDDKMELIANGWDLQCHTHTHPISPNLTGHTASQLHQEMQNVNNHFINDLGLPPPKHHAYPGGGNNQLVRNIVGIYRQTMRTTQQHFFTNEVNKKQIPTFTPSHDPFYIIDTVLKRGLHAIVVLHELEEGSEHLTFYRNILDYSQEKGLRLVTMSELHDEILKNN